MAALRISHPGQPVVLRDIGAARGHLHRYEAERADIDTALARPWLVLDNAIMRRPTTLTVSRLR